MPQRFLLLLLLLSISFGTAWAQTSSISGRILDATNQTPLIGANVLIRKLAADSVKSGAAADVEGNFRVPDLAAGRYEMVVSFLGYQTLRQQLTLTAQPLVLGTVALSTGGVTLKGVEVVGKAAAAIQKGDTSQFNAGSYKTNPDANAQDLITKMPGVVVDPTTGKVQAQGEQVQRVLVDGKEFFGNDPDAVLKNIPAEVIDKIQVYDRASDQAQFTGFDDGNQQKTINIVTKPQFRNGQFGRVLAGYGPQDDRYRVSGNLNSFKGKQRMSIVAQSNNINEQNFGTDDLLGVVGGSGGGGGGRGGRGGGGGGSNNSGDFLVNQTGGISRTNAVGLNYSNSWGKNTELTSSYFFNLTDNTASTSLLRRYVAPPDRPLDQRYNENSLATSRNINNRFNVRLEHRFDSANSIIWQPRISVQRNTSNSSLEGRTFQVNEGEPEFTQGSNTSSYRSANTGINANNQLQYRHRFAKRGRTASVGLNTGYNTRNGDNTLLSDTESSRDSVTRISSLNQFSNLDQTGWTWNGNLNYTEPISQYSQLQAEYRLSYTPNQSDKRTYDYVLGEEAYNQLNDTLSSVFESRYLTNSGGLTYRYQNKELQWTVGATVQHAQLRSDQEFPRAALTERSFLNVLPNAQLRYNFSRQQNLRLFYRVNTNAPSIGQLQEVVNNTNPLQLTAGNPDLLQATQHNVNIRFSSAVPEKSTSFFVALNGSVTNNYITNSTIYATSEPLTVAGVVIPVGGQLTRPVNLDQQYSVRSFANYSLPLSFIKSNLNINGNVGFSQTPGLVFNELNYSRTPSGGLGVVLSSNISPELDFTISSNSSQNYVRNSLQQQLNRQYFRQNTSLRLSWIITKGITLQSDVNHQYYNGLSAGFNQSFVLWNASIGKKFMAKQQAEIKLFAFDLLGQNNSIQVNNTSAYTEDVRTNILQRYLMLMFTYNIRSFAGNGRPDAAPGDEQPRERRPGGFRPEGGGRPGGGGFDRPGGGL